MEERDTIHHPISNRSYKLKDSPIRKLAAISAKTKEQGVHIYHLNIGQPDIPTPTCFLKTIHQENPVVIPYSPSNGELALRKKVASHYNSLYGTDLTEANIFVTVGSSEALLFTFFICTDEGDEILVPDPCYTNYLSIAKILGSTFKPITSYIEHEFRLPDIATFEKQITPKTKAILICNPNNPTGYCYTKQELQLISTLCAKYNLFLIVDEAYRELVYEGESSFAIKDLAHISDKLIVLDTVSKRYSATGARIGFVVSKNKTVLDMMLKIASTRLSPPYLEQIGTMALLDLPKSYFEEVRATYRSRRDTLLKELKTIEGIVCPTPKGAFYVACELPVNDTDVFCKWLLEEFRHENKTVMLTPMSGFYENVAMINNQIRIAYVLNEKDLVDAVKCIKIGIEKYKNL